MPKKAIVLLASGFEEVEAITPVDYLRRAGIEVTTASIEFKAGEPGAEDTSAGESGAGVKSPVVRGARGIPVAADAALGDLLEGGKLSPSDWDAVVVPGGIPGADNIAASKAAGAFLKEMARAGKWVCAICAAPARVLFPLGLLAGKTATCYPGEEEKAGAAGNGIIWLDEKVVVDGNFITSRGAGTAGEFACAIIAKLVDEEEKRKLAEKVLLKI